MPYDFAIPADDAANAPWSPDPGSRTPGPPSHHRRLGALNRAIDDAVARSQGGPEALAALALLLETRLVMIRREVQARQFQPYMPRSKGRASRSGPTAVSPAAPSGAKALVARFRLTPAELRIAGHLAAGLTLKQVTELTGVRTTTLRSQLQAVFDKTGVRRQSALVGLVLRARTGVGSEAGSE